MFSICSNLEISYHLEFNFVRLHLQIIQIYTIKKFKSFCHLISSIRLDLTNSYDI